MTTKSIGLGLASAGGAGPERSLDRLLTLTQLDDSLFQGRSQPGLPMRTFGGEVLGQSVVAAGLTVPEDRTIHSMHAYFLLPGDTSIPVTFRVNRSRDGGSFTTRHVEASQRDRVIFTMTASFQRPTGPTHLAHQIPELADIPHPGDLPHPLEQFKDDEVALAWYRRMMSWQPADLRFPTRPLRALGGTGVRAAPKQQIWVKTASPVEAVPLPQSAVVAYLSDMFLLSSALGPHGISGMEPDLQFATIDHGVWFHAPMAPDEWFLYDMDGFWAGQDRALCRGLMFNEEGVLCATTLQEGLMRRRG